MGMNLAGRHHKFADTARKHIPLRHCPFCGGVNVEAQPVYGDEGRWSIYCARCECTGPVADSRHYAAEIWNHGTGEFKEVG